MKKTTWLLPLGVAFFAILSVTFFRQPKDNVLEVLGFVFGIVSGLLTLLFWIDNKRSSAADSSPSQITEARDMLRLLITEFVDDETVRRDVGTASLMPFAWCLVPPESAKSKTRANPPRRKSAAADLADLLTRDEPGITVIVGNAGAGKSTLCLAGAACLVEKGKHDPATRVPLMIPADSWSPRYRNLGEWAADWIRNNFAQFRDSVKYGATAVETLILQGSVALIIDGFEDIDKEHRSDVARLLEARPAKTNLIVSTRHKCRKELVRLADREKGGRVIRLLPPRLDDVLGHLAESNPEWKNPAFATDPGAAGQALRSVLASHLGVSLARHAYAAPGGKPQELLDSDRFKSSNSIKMHMWSRFLPATFRAGVEHRKKSALRLRNRAHWPSNAVSTSWDPDRATKWLGHLARHMSTTANELRWQHYHRSVGGAWFAPMVLLSTLLTSAGFFALTSISSSDLAKFRVPYLIMTVTGVWTLLSISFIVALLRKFIYEPHVDSINGLSFVAGGSAALWAASPDSSASVRLLFGAQIWAATATLLKFLYRTQRRLWPRYPSPEKAFHLAGRHALINTVSFSTFYWVMVAGPPVSGPWDFGRISTMADGDIMMASGIFALFATSSLVLTHWGVFVSSYLVSSARGWLPFRLTRFLADASRLGILHRVGTSYYFKHAELCAYLRLA